jgi:hypothetical protein
MHKNAIIGRSDGSYRSDCSEQQPFSGLSHPAGNSLAAMLGAPAAPLILRHT